MALRTAPEIDHPATPPAPAALEAPAVPGPWAGLRGGSVA